MNGAAKRRPIDTGRTKALDSHDKFEEETATHWHVERVSVHVDGP